MAEKEINTIMYGVHRDCTACSAKSTEFQLGITPTASSSRTAKKKNLRPGLVSSMRRAQPSETPRLEAWVNRLPKT